MAGTVFATTGLNEVGRILQGMVDGVREEGSWWVGTVVAYSSYLEFGTSKMSARPYFEPAIREVASRFDDVVGEQVIFQTRTGRSVGALRVTSGEAGVSKRVAFALERAVKEKIKEKGLIDTGNLRASIVAAPDLPTMRKLSAAQLDDAIDDDQIDLSS